MEQLHGVLAWLAVVGALALLGAAIVTAADPSRSYRLLDRAILVQVAGTGLATLSGLVLPIAGRGPGDPLHFLYALVALTAAPQVRYATRGGDARRMGRWQVVAAIVVAGSVFRLFMTGR